jgi:hypothetical protein
VLARIAIVRKGDTGSGEYELVTYPSGETHRMTPGASADISKAVIEVFTRKFLQKSGVISLSERVWAACKMRKISIALTGMVAPSVSASLVSENLADEVSL